MRGRLLSLAAAGGVAVLSACGGGEAVVQALAEAEGGQTTPIGRLEVRALPYDRDAIFDSLRAEYPEPEPEIPDSLADLQNRVMRAQQAWRDAETRWNTARDSLRQLLELTQTLPRQSPRYRLAFADYNEQEDRANTAERQSREAFSQFEGLQSGYNTQVEQLRVRRELWADEAYVQVDSVINSRIAQARREPVVDTTDANGVARLKLKPGQWWVHARYDLLFDEMYWNVPVEVERGDPVPVMLDRSTAQIRPQY